MKILISLVFNDSHMQPRLRTLVYDALNPQQMLAVTRPGCNVMRDQSTRG